MGSPVSYSQRGDGTPHTHRHDCVSSVHPGRYLYEGAAPPELRSLLFYLALCGSCVVRVCAAFFHRRCPCIAAPSPPPTHSSCLGRGLRKP
jgi:hypothetical protein